MVSFWLLGADHDPRQGLLRGDLLCMHSSSANQPFWPVALKNTLVAEEPDHTLQPKKVIFILCPYCTNIDVSKNHTMYGRRSIVNCTLDGRVKCLLVCTTKSHTYWLYLQIESEVKQLLNLKNINSYLEPKRNLNTISYTVYMAAKRQAAPHLRESACKGNAPSSHGFVPIALTALYAT